MKFLRNIPGLIKRHYEKVILVFALLGLITAVVYLNDMKNAENENIAKYNKGITKRKPNPVPSIDITALTTALDHAKNPSALNFAPPHNLFNPVKWQRRQDGTILKVETGKEVGAEALEVAKISPLNLIITLDQAAGSGFNMGVLQEGATNAAWRRKFVSYVTTNSPADRVHGATKAFKLVDVNRATQPPEVSIELTDGKIVTVSADKPFTRVMGYKVDLNYPPEKRMITDRRAGDSLMLGDEVYNIVAITTNEVVISARSNNRRTFIRNNAAP